MSYRLLFMVMTWTLTNTAQNRDDWIDPNDMLNFDPATNTMKKVKVDIADRKLPIPQESLDKHLSEPDLYDQTNTQTPDAPQSCPPCPVPKPCPNCQCDSVKECTCEQASVPLLRRYIRSLLEHIGEQLPITDTEDYTIHISLSKDQASILQKFASAGDQKHVHDVHEILADMIDRIGTSRAGKLEKMVRLFEEKIGITLERLVQFSMLGTLASIILVIELKLQIAWGKRIVQLTTIFFLISIPWTWYDLYKQVEIHHHTTASRPIPKECMDLENDTLSALWIGIKSYFTLQADKCHEYHEHLMVDPLVKVPPTKAIAVTFVRFFLAPAKDVGSAISEFLRALLVDLPLTLYPVALAMVAIFFFMLLFMWFGYSIRLPFFLTIERSPQLSVADSQLHQAIKETSEQAYDQLKKMQERLELTGAELVNKMKHMEQVQQASIEYNISSHPQSPAESPTLQKSDVEKINSRKGMSDVKGKSMSPSKSDTKVKVGSPVKLGTKSLSRPNVSDIDAAPHEADSDTSDSFEDFKIIGNVGKSGEEDNFNKSETVLNVKPKLRVDTLKPDGTMEESQ